MNYWLVKSEPDAWSWEQQVKKGIEPWTGVRNFQAAANLKAMKKGDQAFFYHSNVGKEIVGIVEVVREAYPDPTDEKGRFIAVDVRTVRPLKRPVSLAELKENKAMGDMALLRSARLSVQPVHREHWNAILELSRRT